MQRACADDQLAWQRLCRLFGPSVYRAARKLGLGVEDAADIVQEVFTSVARNLARFDRSEPGSTFRGWLYVITRNKVRDRARMLSRRLETAPATDLRLDINLAVDDVEDDVANDVTETQRIVHRALEVIQIEFERTTWRAFQRVAVDGVTAAEVADELSMTVGAVYQAKSRVLRRLREELDGLI